MTTSTSFAQTTLGLPEVLARAREQAPRIVTARLAVAEARGRSIGAAQRSQSNPEADIAFGSRRGDATRWTDAQFGVAHTLEASGRRPARLAAATAAVDQGTAAVETTAREVLLDASLLFYQAIYAAERIRLLTSSVELARSVAEVADRRFQAGDLAVLDVHLARGALARTEAARAAAEAEEVSALGDLRALLRLDGPLTVRGTLTDLSPPDPVALATTVDGRPELRVLEAGIREAEADLALAKTYAKPDYGLGLRYEHEGPDHIVVGGLTVSIPLFSRGQASGATAAARGARLRAELDAERARGRIELHAALDVYARLRAAAQTLETGALSSLEDAEALTSRSFDVGQIGLPDVLLIRRELLDTRVQYLSAQLEVARSRVLVDAAAGALR
jgi:cobalt-zinc-cadmium efflux system outer membrane protein